MTLDLEALKNKQRIIITGNHGLDKITNLIRTVLDHCNKPYCYLDDTFTRLDDSPIVIMKGGFQLINGAALFHQYAPHIALIHKVSDKVPDGYKNFEHFLNEIEKLADNLPKAGSIIFSEHDDITTIIGRKEREDVKPIEYGLLTGEPTSEGYKISNQGESFMIRSDNKNFLSHGAAARALTRRIGISDHQFYEALKAN